MPKKQTPVWLPRVLFESALIVASILAALAFDEWREDRQDDEIMQFALLNFSAEIRQNKMRMDDTAPFNSGLRQVVARHYRDDDVRSVDEFVNMVASYSPARLQSTAWDTALATGSLAKMEYELVAALSMTYSLQNRYVFVTGTGLRELTSPQNLSDRNFRLAIYNSLRYLDDVIGMEAELGGTYIEATSVIDAALVRMGLDSGRARNGVAADVAHP
ncbi:MAG: hypothetical protein IIB77_06990 [Proteobacteria bacterium]|nr:hypothetical protein [Pseudomonadota bacterium]